MSWLVRLLGELFLSVAGSVLIQMLVAAGMALVTYEGVDVAITFLKTGLVSSFLGLPQQLVGLLALMKVGACISMFISAVVMRMTLQGFKSGTVKSWVKK